MRKEPGARGGAACTSSAIRGTRGLVPELDACLDLKYTLSANLPAGIVPSSRLAQTMSNFFRWENSFAADLQYNLQYICKFRKLAAVPIVKSQLMS